mgnify:FL=1
MTKVFLSAGHGGNDSGACAYGLKEKDINLQTLLACNEVLIAHGVQTVCSRTKDENDPVTEEVREANASGASLAVSFHANAGKGDGFEAFYYSTDKKGKSLAQLGEKYVKELGQNSRGLKPGDKLMFVNSTKMTAVLFESFFVDNDTDNDIGDTVAEQRAFGTAYAKAILEHLGITYKGSVAAVNTERHIKPGPAHLKKDCQIYNKTWKKVVMNAKKDSSITVLDYGTWGVKVKCGSTEGYIHCENVMPDIKPGDKLRAVKDVTVTIKKGTQLVSQDSGYLGNIVNGNFAMASEYL